MSAQKIDKTEEYIEIPVEKPKPSPSGTKCGVEGVPYWNPISFQFMFAPRFQFQTIPGAPAYRYIATDEQGVDHVFESDKSTDTLSSIWKEIPEGVVSLKVWSLNAQKEQVYLVGARTFFRLANFTEDLPPRACGYKEASLKAYEYAFHQDFLQNWITAGKPFEDYDHYVYPSKMITSIIHSMIKYAGMCPENAEAAMTIAKNSADYLIGLTAKDGPMKGIPPTYQLDFRPDWEKRNNLAAKSRIDWCMMIYPPAVADAYLDLEAATHDKKYYDAAMAVAEYMADHVEESGSWSLVRSISTGEILNRDLCDPLQVICPFLMKMYSRTGDEKWKKLADNGIAYVERTKLPGYLWGAQFEDSRVSVNYANLSHYPATALVRFYATYYKDDEKKMKIARDVMRFAEDQFVIWKRPSPWNCRDFDTSLWPTPCGLEQYVWHVPIDASTADIMKTFLVMYQAGCGDVFLKKAKALGDSITRQQQPDGMIPTHWMNKDYLHGKGLWINCLFASSTALLELGEFLGE